MNTMRVLVTLALAAVLAMGCATSRSGKVYSRDEARRVQQVEMGTVVAVQEVTIEGTKSKIGAAAGGIAGGISARGGGSGTGDKVAGVLGAIAGGVAGAAAEEALTRRPGLEITVALDGGKTVSIVQEADETFAIDDRVRLLTQPDGTTRVSH